MRPGNSNEFRYSRRALILPLSSMPPVSRLIFCSWSLAFSPGSEQIAYSPRMLCSAERKVVFPFAPLGANQTACWYSTALPTHSSRGILAAQALKNSPQNVGIIDSMGSRGVTGSQRRPHLILWNIRQPQRPKHSNKSSRRGSHHGLSGPVIAKKKAGLSPALFFFSSDAEHSRRVGGQWLTLTL